MNHNCPNCAAPYDTKLNTCPYCGTSYFDMSCIDFEDCKPIFLKLKINLGGAPAYITQKVIPRMGGINISSNTTDIRLFDGTVVKSIVGSKTMTTDVSFEAVYDYNDNSLCQVVKGGE